jgi:sialic acid synthase SpsE
MATLEGAFGVPVGLSDHTPGVEIALAAVALGARVLEKHFTLDRGLPGPDHAASLEPDDLARMVAGIRKVEAALGDGVKEPAAVEAEMRIVARRSLAAARDLGPGSRLGREDLIALRPGAGISPMEIDALVGRVLRRSIGRGALLSRDDLE